MAKNTKKKVAIAAVGAALAAGVAGLLWRKKKSSAKTPVKKATKKTSKKRKTKKK